MDPSNNSRTSSTTSSAGSSYDHQTSGNALDFDVHVGSSIQALHEGSSTINLWDGTLLFSFASGQSTVRLTFRPTDNTYALDGTCVDSGGNSVAVQFSGNKVVITLPSTTEEFTIEMKHVDVREGSGSSGGHPGGMSKLVLTTDEPTPDPDLRPITSGTM